MDEFDPIEIEFLINNPQLVSDSKKAEQTLTGVSNKVQEQCSAATSAISDQITRMNQMLVDLRNKAATADPFSVGTYTQQIKNLEASLIRVKSQQEDSLASVKEAGKAGKDAFEQVEQSATKSGNAFTKAYSYLRQIAYALPGVGIAGLIGFATEPIIKYIASLDLFNKKLTETQLAQQSLNNALASTEYTTAVKNVAELTENIQLAKQGFLDKDKVLREYNKTLGSTLGYADSLNAAEKHLIDQGAAYIQITQLKAAAQLSLNDSAKAAYEAEQKRQKDAVEFESAGTNLKSFGVGQSSAPGYVPGSSDFKAGAAARLKDATDEKNKQVKVSQDEADEKLKIYQSFQKKAADIAKKNKIDFFDGTEDNKNTGAKEEADAVNTLLKQQISLQERIKEFTNRTDARTLSPDQSALTQISDQFNNIRFQIQKSNSDYDAFVKKFGAAAVTSFNANPNNKVKLAKTDPNTLNDAEFQAQVNQANLNENTYIQQDLDKKKKMYADYEAYKLKAGSAAADAEYKDLLQSGKDFATYLDTLNKSVDANDQTGPIQQRRELIKKATDANIQEQKKAFETLLLSTITYQEKRQAIEQAGIDAEKKLNDAGYTEQADQVKQQTQDELTALDEANFKKLDAYKQLFNGIVTLTRQQAGDNINKLYASAAAGLASGNLTIEAYFKIIKQLDQAALALKNSGTPETLQEIGAAFGEIANAVSGLNGTLGALIGTVGNALSSLGKIEQLQNNIADAAKSGIPDIKDEISLYATAATGIISLIGNITTAAAKRKEAETAYYDAVIASQNQYNLALDDQIRLQAELNKNVFLKDYKADIADASQALAKENQQFAASLVALQAGQAKTGTKNAVDSKSVLNGAGTGATAGAAIGAIVGGGVLSVPAAAAGAIIGGLVGAISGLFGGKKKVDALGPLLGIYPDLITKDKNGVDQLNEALAKNLIQNNLVTDSTKVLLQNTIDLNDARQAAIDQINQDITDLAGSLGDDLRNALVTAFEDGTDAAKAFGDSVSKVIENIVSQFLFQDIFGSEFDKLSNNLKGSFSITGDQNATDDLTQFFKDAGPLVQQYQQALEAAKQAGAKNGLDLFDPNSASGGSSNATVSGQIKGITEDQANILEGVDRGIQLAVVKSNELIAENTNVAQNQLAEMQKQTLVQMQIAANTERTADNTDVLPAMRDSLANIDKNTAASTGAILRGAGIIK